MSPIAQFAVAFALLYVIVYFVSEQIQEYLYNRPMDGLWWRALPGCIPLALLAVLFPSRLETMFTVTPYWTLLQALAWFLVFWGALGFHRDHAAVAGIVMYLLTSTIISLSLDSLSGTGAA